MSVPGIAAMLHMLSGGSKENADKYYGRVVTAAAIADDVLRLTFADGAQIAIRDDGQSCCEARYMTTDDKVDALIGGTLRLIASKRHEEKPGKYGDEHEMVFVEIATDKASVTIVNHNEHNGYYGGFGLTIEEVAHPAGEAA